MLPAAGCLVQALPSTLHQGATPACLDCNMLPPGIQCCPENNGECAHSKLHQRIMPVHQKLGEKRPEWCQ